MTNGIFAYRHHIREMIKEDDLLKILDALYNEEESDDTSKIGREVIQK